MQKRLILLYREYTQLFEIEINWLSNMRIIV